MSTELKLRRGTALEHKAFTGANGEATYVTDQKDLRVHDGETPGGHSAAQANKYDGIKALQNTQLKDRAQYDVAGFYAGTEVGGGTFIYDDSRDKADHTGGIVIAPEAIAAWDGTHDNLNVLLDWSGTGTGVFVRVSEFLRPEYFGAVRDGSTDDTLAIQRAMDSSAMSGRGILSLSVGTYRVTDTLYQRCSIVGAGGPFQSWSKIIIDNETPKRLLEGDNNSGLVRIYPVKGVAFDSAQTGSGSRIHTALYGNLYQVPIEKCRFLNMAIGTDFRCVYGRFENCEWTLCDIGSYPRLNSDGDNTQTTMLSYEKCAFIYCGKGLSIEERFPAQGTNNEPLNVFLSNTGFEQCDYGAYVTERSWNTTWINCWWEACAIRGLYAPEGNHVIINPRYSSGSNSDVPVLPDLDNNFDDAFTLTGRGADAKRVRTTRIEKLTGANEPDNLIYDPDLFFGRAYKSVGSSVKEHEIFQQYSDDTGNAATASISFYRADAPGSATGSEIRFGTTGTTGSQDAPIDRVIIDRNGNLLPATDNSNAVGSASNRFSEIFAATGSINTSDETLKTELLDVSEKEKLVAKEIKSSIKKYKFIDAVEEKGDKARVHFGVGAQTVKSIFESHGLNANDYGLFCYDEWWEIDGERVEADENGSVTRVWFEHNGSAVDVQDSSGRFIDSDGDEKYAERKSVTLSAQRKGRYGIRYDELTMFILAAL